MKIAIISNTETGMFVAGKLFAASLDVTLFDITPARKQSSTINTDIKSSIQLPEVNWQLIEDFKQIYDYIFLFSNNKLNSTIIPIIKDKIKRDCVIISFQNQLSDDSLKRELAPNLVLTGATNFQISINPLNKIVLTTDHTEFLLHAFDLSSTSAAFSEDMLEAKNILDYVGQTFIVKKSINIRWSQALFSISIDRLSSALNCCYGDIMYHDIALQTSIHLADEVARTAKKQQIKLANSYSTRFNDLIIDSDSKFKELITSFKAMIQINHKSRSTFKYTEQNEIDYIDEIIHYAKINDQPTPYLELLRDCLHYQKSAEFHENIQKFAPLIEGRAVI